MNIAVNSFFFFYLGWGIFGIALGTGVVALTNFIILYVLMRGETSSLGTRDLAKTFARLLVPAGLLALICWQAQVWFFTGWAEMRIWTQAALLITTIAVASVAYFGAAMLMRIEEMEDLKAVVRRRLNRRRPPAA
jgi:putative peptidoglycan lipid II flippase